MSRVEEYKSAFENLPQKHVELPQNVGWHNAAQEFAKAHNEAPMILILSKEFLLLRPEDPPAALFSEVYTIAREKAKRLHAYFWPHKCHQVKLRVIKDEHRSYKARSEEAIQNKFEQMSKAGTADTAYTRIGFDSSTGEFVDYCPNCGDILPDNQKYICRKKHILSDYIKKLIQMPDGIEKLDKIIDVLYSYPDAWWYYSQSELRKNITSKTLDVIDTNEYMLIHGLHKYTSTLKDNNTINWNTKISMQNFAKRLANFISSPNIDTDQPIIADIIQSQQPQTLVHPSFVPVVPASERDLVDNFSASYIRHAWGEIAHRRRGLPDNWICRIDLSILSAAGFVSFTACEKDSAFIAEITADDGSIFILALSKRNSETYQGELGLLVAYILIVIADMVCYTDESPISRDRGPNSLRGHSQSTLKRVFSHKNMGKRYYPIKQREAATLDTTSGKRQVKATYVTWHWMRLRPGCHASPRAIMNALAIAGWEEDLPIGSTFVKPHFFGKGETDEKLAVATHLCKSFVMTITKLLNSNIRHLS